MVGQVGRAQPAALLLQLIQLVLHVVPLLLCHTHLLSEKNKEEKDCAFWRQLDEKPGCPGTLADTSQPTMLLMLQLIQLVLRVLVDLMLYTLP